MTGERCLLWVQSLLGSGHLRRALTLAGALARDGLEVTVANGGPRASFPIPSGVRLVQLPAVRSASADFARLVTGDGEAVGPEVWRARRELLAALVEELRPQVLMTELFPFGRGAFREELLPVLALARGGKPRPLVLASVRDILVSKRDPAKHRRMLETFDACYAAVLVHGDPALLPFRDSFPLADRLGDRLLYTGLVVPELPEGAPPDRPAVLISAGGGVVGADLLLTALAARPLTRFATHPWLLVTGEGLPADHLAALKARLPPGVTLARHRADLARLIGAAEVSVSQAGYNTVAEALATGARMVLVPFAAGGEDEQTRRAARLASLRLATRLPEAELTPTSLAAAIDRAAALPRPDPSGLALDGAARTAALVRTLLHRHALS